MIVATIDVSRHAVIEASAGTGKTYTIEQLVLRLLIETPTTLDRILLVTFTDKATGELQTRLRQTLERARREQPQHDAILVRALDQFDQASIFTIHGFCQRLLQEHALEQGQDFRAALVADPELMPQLLREVQRKVWRREFGDKLRDVLEAPATTAPPPTSGTSAFARRRPSTSHTATINFGPRQSPTGGSGSTNPGSMAPASCRCSRSRRCGGCSASTSAQRGLHSFDDMIATVEASLDPRQSPGPGAAPSAARPLSLRHRR